MSNPERRAHFSWRGLVPQLFALIILPLSALLILTTFGGLALHQQSMRDLAAERDERTARATATILNVLILQRLATVQELASSANGGASAQEFADALSEKATLLGNMGTGLAYFAADGELLASEGERSLWEHVEPGTLLTLAQQTGPGEVSHQLIFQPADREPVWLVVAPSEDGSVIAAGSFSPSAFIQRALTDVFAPGGESSVFVVTPDRQVLYQQGIVSEEVPLASHPGVSQSLQGKAGATYLPVGDAEHVVAFSPIETTGWALVIEEPWETIASRLLRVTENVPLVLIPILILAVLALLFATRYIVQPLQTLEARAAELGQGDFQSIEDPVGGISEIRNLQAELIHLARKVRAAQKGLRDYIGAITLGQEEERRRLARELHDDTTQSLIALNQRLQLAQLSLSENPETLDEAETISEIQRLAEQTIQDLRRLTRALRPAYLEELGLVAALEMLARESDQTQGLSVEFQRFGVERRLAPEAELALYRMAQEALTNVVKHARAKYACLQIAFTEGMVSVEISDDGQGFEVPESPTVFTPGGHFGLLGLHERAEMIGAHLEIQSKPGEGSQVAVLLPLLPEKG